MVIRDPKKLISQINSNNVANFIEFGCGPKRFDPNYITIDLLEDAAVDIQADVFDFLKCINESTISGIYASHFIEHVDDLKMLLENLAFVCKPGADIEFIVPHFSNPFFYSDYTHKVFFGLYSFCYLASDKVGFRRPIPTYGMIPKFDLISAEIKFKSYRPNYIRHGVKRSIEKLVNMSLWTKEFYEENLSWIIPGYELRFLLKRNST